ncbi:hypothetical protein [Capnocytophaga ochracea]|nr:hypothetical protein [Capnocytophaga ochracea]
MSGSTVALQWLYSGSTVMNKRPNDEENLPLTPSKGRAVTKFCKLF